MNSHADATGSPPRGVPSTRRRAPRAVALLAALDGLSGTALSALASHLPDRAFISGGREIAWHAIWMQMWHAPVLLALAMGMSVDRRLDRMDLRVATFGLAGGLVLFCGAVYAIAFAGRYSGPVAPTGGIVIMASWIGIGVSVWRVRS